MAARSKARKRALDLLFEADQRGLNVTLAARAAAGGAGRALAGGAVRRRRSLQGVVAKWADIDELLTTYSQGWTVDRMPGVNRAILRIGAWEVVWNDDVPDAVAISEAVELARGRCRPTTRGRS